MSVLLILWVIWSSLILQGGGCKRVLLCVGDTLGKHLDPNDHKSRLLLEMLDLLH